MSQSFSNAFPIESIGRDIARNNYNYESIFNALMEWNNSDKDYVAVRLMKNSAPHFHTWTFPTKKAQSKTASISLVSPIASNAFDLDGEYGMVAATDSTEEGKDDVVIRINVVNSGGTRWRAFVDTFVFDNEEEAETLKYAIFRKAGDTEGLFSLYIVDSAKSDTSDAIVTPLISEYNSDNASPNALLKHHFIINEGSVYAVTENGPLYLNELGTSKAVYVGTVWAKGNSYNKGDLVVRVGLDENYHMFVNLAEDNANLSDPYDYIGTMTDGKYTDYTGEDQLWKEIVLLPISNVFNSSSVIRMKPDNDFRGVVLQNADESYAEINVNIGIEGNIKYKMTDSKYVRRVRIFDTSNYTMFPYSTSDIWMEGRLCNYDPNIPITKRQEYSASMVFDHSRDDVSTVNYINYDGPDLDQGLCIYLPVHGIYDNGSGENTPEDGYTFDFFFRIWPTPEYNGHSTSDLIINKAQIYVYSVEDEYEAKIGSCTLNPLAKFSMARLTNFYVYDENIGVPNRPVMYRATFVYSASDKQWKLYDYYQLPDHVFIGPVGFVDPTNKGILNDSRPGNEYKGYETAGFPMFADPFQKTSLEPVQE
jgi:hypothetical protein